jgi:type I restriction enzyme R subunit
VGKRADYLLRYTRDVFLAVVEAKASYKNPSDGLQQAKDYAQILGLKWAYSTNGHGIVEFDFTTGKESERTDFPSPSELWARQRSIQKLTSDATAEQFLTPFNLTTAKEPRYYQEIAINAAVRAFLQGHRRALLAGEAPPTSSPSRRAIDDRTASGSSFSPSIALDLTTSAVNVVKLASERS